MRQCNRCGSVRKDAIFNSHLGSGLSPLSQHPLSPSRRWPHQLTPSTKTTILEETKNPEKISNSQQITWYCPGPMYTEPRGKRGSQCITFIREIVN